MRKLKWIYGRFYLLFSRFHPLYFIESLAFNSHRRDRKLPPVLKYLMYLKSVLTQVDLWWTFSKLSTSSFIISINFWWDSSLLFLLEKVFLAVLKMRVEIDKILDPSSIPLGYFLFLFHQLYHVFYHSHNDGFIMIIESKCLFRSLRCFDMRFN